MIRPARFAQIVAQIVALGAVAALAGCNSAKTPTYDGGSSSSGGSNGASASNGGSNGGSATNGGSSNGGSNGGSTGSVSSSQACSDYANAECALYNSCTDGYNITLNYGDLPTCLATFQSYCNNRLAVPASDTALTSTQIEACAQALPSEACVNLFGGDNTAPCNPAQGPLANGSTCSLSAECQSAFCGTGKAAVCGTCQAAPVAGGSCANNQCPAGLICSSSSETCEAPVPDGGACGVDDDCVFGFSCLNGDGGLNICQPAGVAGASCDLHNRVGPPCFSRNGFFCMRVSDGGVCTARAFAAATEECGTINGVDTVCEQSGLCVKAQPDAGTGTCEAYAADGTACDSVVGPNCLPLSRCVPTSPSGTAGICTAEASESCGVFTTGGGSSGGVSNGGSTGGAGSTSGGIGGSTGGALNTIALVDNDGYVDGTPGDDTVLPVWQNLMSTAGITAYDLITIANDGSQSWAPNTVPSTTQLAQYNTLIWFSADNDGFPTAGADWAVSTDQQENLTAWLDLGGKTLVVFSEYFAKDYYGSDAAAWTSGGAIPFFTSYVPLQGAEQDPYQWSAANGDTDLEGSNFTAAGTSVIAGFGALTWDVVEANTDDTVCVLNPATGTDSLATVQSDPLETDTMNITSPVAVGKKLTGAKSTSTVVYVGFPIEDLVSGGSFSTQQAFFNGVVQTYAGVP